MAELVVALDVPDTAQALKIADKLSGWVSWFKVGLELFTAAGPELVKELKQRGFRIFLDLKFYDIPHTVARAVHSACRLNVDMLTLHLQGGKRMCEAAKEALGKEKRPLLMGVTVLTSFASGEMPGIDEDLQEYGAFLAGCANDWSLNGVVCSGFEAERIKSRYPSLLCLCPGIRPDSFSGDDQRRFMTPENAVRAGADFLVVGRPVLMANDPVGVARKILEKI